MDIFIVDDQEEDDKKSFWKNGSGKVDASEEDIFEDIVIEEE